jgi:parallel beta-helix repeat protein
VHNFCIGVEGTGTNNNVIEENIALGNSNGLYLTAGTQGNIIHGNTLTGNPAVQTDVDHPSDSGVDILNLANGGDNAFVGNVCMTSVNAPCSTLAPSLTASPNPIPIAVGAILGQTTINWNAPDAQVVEVHLGGPNGPLFAGGGNRGSAQTGTWVSDGLTFYLQDVTGGSPLTSDYTLAVLVVHLQHSSSGHIGLLSGFRAWDVGTPAIGLALLLCGIILPRTGKRVRVALAGTTLLAAAFVLPSVAPGQERSKLDQMIASGTGQQDLARYVFDTQGCKNCHTMGHDGKLGFTAKGNERARSFEGCIRMLTAMTVVVQVPEEKRSPQQRQKAQRFEEFGCTACHKLVPGKMALTEIGAKLAGLHLGCVDVEKLTSSGAGSRN